MSRFIFERTQQTIKYPNFDILPHWAPNLYDPFNWHSKMSKEKKQRRLRVEINNGRLAMIGLMGLLSEQSIPGSVPFFTDVVPADYYGNIFAPFEHDFDINTIPSIQELSSMLIGTML